MAEIIAGPFVAFVVERLGDVLIQKKNLLRGVSGQVEEMQRELNRMKRFLKDAAKKQEVGDERVHNWVAEIREAAYDAEAVIDTYIIKVAFRRETGSILNVLMRYSCVFMLKDCIDIHKVGVEIESIKTNISKITTSLDTYGVTAISEGESSRIEKQRLKRMSYRHIVEDDIVGLDDDIKTIAEQLVKEERQCRVVSIWGMGGLGKTTLAKKVYNHVNVKCHFDCFAWAFISQQCNVREVLEGILIQLSTERREQIKLMKHEELVEKLFEVQIQKKCLVVIDDIWKAEDWKILSPAFPNEEVAGSKILLTTRIKEVASYADQLHEVRPLTETDSWKLFGKKAFSRTNVTEFESSTEMMELGKEMVKHCGGLPLAIVVLGGLLANKHKMEEWKMVSRNINYYLNKKGEGSHARVRDILALSYQDLPYHLKACFLCLSHLPEDYEIPAEKLVQMWMAEGIVSSSSSSSETMLDVGMSYLSELAQRCMVQVQLTRFSRRIKLCRLHDLMRDLCLSKAQEENFLKVVCVEAFDNQQLKWENSASSPLNKIRRLAVYYLGDHDANNTRREYINLKELTNHHHLRSCQFYFFGNDLEISGWEQIKSLLKGFKLLRILDVESMKIKEWKGMLLGDIGNLFHLRYLNINGCIESVPSSIGNLRFLQTLDLRITGQREIPNVLWRLEQLRHLYLPHNIKLTGRSKLRLDGLSKLETLEGFYTECCDVRYFPKLTNLRKVEVRSGDPKDLAVILKSPILLNNSNSLLLLSVCFTIVGDFRMEEEQSLLRQLLGCHHLRKLELRWFLNSATKFPDQFPPNLTKLFLQDTELEEDPMPTLEKLPNLRTLFLFKTYIGKEMVCSSGPSSISGGGGGGGGGYGGCDGGGFPKLMSLTFYSLYNLEEWRVEQGAMPCLFRLEINHCEKLKEIPDGLRFITTLRELDIISASKALQQRVREGGEDFCKVQHVPSIISD